MQIQYSQSQEQQQQEAFHWRERDFYVRKLGDHKFDSGQVSDRNDRSINILQVKHQRR